MKKRALTCILGIVALGAWSTGSGAERIYDPVKYGAVADGETLCTEAIQKAIDECAAAGGGVVRLPKGKIASSTIVMKSNVTLDIPAGSTLLGPTRWEFYPQSIPGVAGITPTRRSLIIAEKCTNIAFTGKGTIDGRGVRSNFKGTGKYWNRRPYLFRIVQCKGVRMEDLTIKDPVMWAMHYLACDDVTIRGITVFAHVQANNDGMDIDSCHNVLIENCTIDSDDDGICLKSSYPRACENVTVRNCTMSSRCNVFKCGTGSWGGFKNITVTDCVIKPCAFEGQSYTHPGFPPREGLAGIALEIVDGGVMENVTIKNIRIEGTLSPIFIRLGNMERPWRKGILPHGVGTLRNVTLENIKCTGASDMGCAIVGLPGHRIENLTLKNVEILSAGGGTKEEAVRQFDEKEKVYPEPNMFAERLPAYGLFCWHVKGLTLENVKLTTKKPDERLAIVLEDALDVVVDGKPVRSKQDLPEGVQLVNQGYRLTAVPLAETEQGGGSLRRPGDVPNYGKGERIRCKIEVFNDAGLSGEKMSLRWSARWDASDGEIAVKGDTIGPFIVKPGFHATQTIAFTPPDSATCYERKLYLVLESIKDGAVVFVEDGICFTIGGLKWTKVDDHDKAVSYSPGWKIGTGRWTIETGHGGYTEHYSQESGATATFTFSGTNARVYGYRRRDLGIVDILVDGKVTETLDLYQPGRRAGEYGMLYETPELPVGKHTLQLKVTGRKNSKSRGEGVIVDAFEFATVDLPEGKQD